MNLQVEFIHGDPVADVSVQAICFFDQQDSARFIFFDSLLFFEKIKQSCETSSSNLFGRLDIDEFTDNEQFF